MAGLFQPKRVQVPGLLSDEGLSVALKNLSDTTKTGAQAAPPNLSAVDAANQITTEALKPQPTVKTAAPRVPGVELSAGAPAAPAAPTDTRVGFGGTVTGFDVGKAIVQAGTLTPAQGEADRIERAAQAGAEAEVATGELAEKTDLLSADEREAIGLPPQTPDDMMRLSSSIAQEQQIVADKAERAKFIKEGPAATQAEWLNIAQVSTRSAIQMGVGTLRYPADIWDTLAAIEKGSDEIKKSEVSLYLDNVDKALTSMMPGDKTRSKDFTTKLAAGTGSMVGFMITGWAGRAVGLPAWLTTGTLGAAVEGDSLYQEADTFGATATQKLIALFAGSALGVTEAVPIDRAFMRADTATGGMIRNLLANTTSSSLEEFIQEASQSIGEDIIAKYGAGYDPKREISVDKAFENGLIGAITGGVVGGATTLLSNGEPVEHLTQDEAKITETVDAALAEEQQRFASIIGDEGGVDGQGEVAAQAQGASAEAPAGGKAAPAGPDPVRGDAVQQIVENQAAFHGTPHKFDKFSMEKIGTGEGAQAFGHGLYFAGNKTVAEGYRAALSSRATKVLLDGAEFSGAIRSEGGVVSPQDYAMFNVQNNGGVDEALENLASMKPTTEAKSKLINDAAAWLEANRERVEVSSSEGALYKVDIPDDAELLDWDAPLSAQPEAARKALAQVATGTGAVLDDAMTGQDAYRAIAGAGAGNMTRDQLNDWYEDKVGYRPDVDAGKELPIAELRSLVGEMMGFNGGDAAASQALLAAGVPGLRYLDAGSRTQGDGTRNYVIFDDSRITITDVEAQVANPIAQVQLEPIETAPLPNATTGPNPNAVKAARAYTAAAGLPTRRQRDAAPANPARITRIAQAYADMKHEPADPAVLSSYQALVEEVQAQYAFASAAGPLPAPADTPVYPPDHPLAPVAEQFWALHRFFGEGLEGAVDPENMWQAHSRLFSASALPAFTAETRGAAAFAEQFGEPAERKVGQLPSWTWQEGVEDTTAYAISAPVETTDPAAFRTALAAAREASKFGMVTPIYTAPKYAKMRTFLSPDGQSGFALDGEKIVSLFGADPTQLRKIVDTAVANGGRTFEGFDAGLPEMLASLGFRETGRKPWTDAYAPKDWPGELGKPDVVSMEWAGSDVEQSVAPQTEAFKKWFGDSKVIDEAGAPLVVYHGTAIPKTEFGTRNGMGEGAYFTPSRDDAQKYAGMDAEVDGGVPTVMPVYLSLKNPVVLEGLSSQSLSPEQKATLVAAGHDGVIGMHKGKVTEYVVFEPAQIKSAIGNRGTFDPADPNIDRMTGTATVRQPYLAEPTRPTKGIPSPTPPSSNQEDVRLSAISSNFVKVLGLTARHGRLAARDSSVMGEYNRRTAAIRLRTWTDLSTLVHEGGHALNDSMSAPMNAFVAANITQINNIAHKFYAGDLSKATGETVRREGFAEFFRVYTLNPAFARNKWPQLVDAFETVIRANDPKVLDGLNSVSAQFDAWLQLPSKQLIRNMVVDGRRESGIDAAVKELRDRGFKGWMSEYARRATGVMINKYVSVAQLEAQLLNVGEQNRGAPIELQRSESPTAILRLARNSGSRAQVQITDGVIGYRSTQSVSRGLREALMTALGIPPDTTPASLDQELMKDFDAYLVARRAFDEYRRFDAGEIERPPIGAQKGDVVRTIKEYEQSQPQFAPAAQIVHEYGMAMWQKRYDAGLMDKETYEEGLQRQFYAPLQRDVSDKQGTGADSIGFSSSVLTKGPRFKGSDRDIISPMTVLMQMTFALEKQIAENDAKRALAILADRAGQAGALVERIPASQLIGQSFTVQQVAARLTADSSLTAADASDLMTILAGSIDKGDMMTLFRSEQAGTQGENVIFFWENGKIAAIRLNDSSLASDVVNTMNAVGRENMDVMLEAVAATSTVFRTAITSWPDFLVVNYIRDQFSAWILGGTNYIPFATGFQGITDEIRQKQWAKSYNAAGGTLGGMTVASLHRARVDRDISALRAKGYTANVFGDANGGWSNVPGVIKGLGRLTALTETGTRLGLYRGAYERAIKDGLSEYDASVEAAYIATDYIDFGLNGSKMLTARRLIPFLNAQLQGLYKMVRTLGGDEVARRKGLGFALGAYFKNINNLPLSRLEQQQLRTGRAAWLKMMSLGLIGAALWAIFRDDPDYQEAGEYLRTTGWVIPTGDGKIFYIPKPFELALVSNAVERGLELATGDTTAIDRFKRGVAFALTPPTAPPAIQSVVEIAANYDFFTGRQVVPDHMQALAPQLQYDNYTSSIAKWVGGATGQSPLVVDHILGGLGASAYRDISTMLNAADPSRPMPDETEWPILRRFVRDVRKGSASAQDFWAQASNTSGKLERAKATYKRYQDVGNQPAANRFLSSLSADERAYAVLMTDFKPEEKRLNPFYRARQVTSIVSGMRRENASELGLGDTTREPVVGEGPLTFQLSRGLRTQVDDILSEIARREVRNTLIATGQPGWVGKEVLDLQPTLDMLLAVSPDTYDEFNRRRIKAKVYDAQSVYDYWPEVRDRLNSDGPDAILSDAVAVAGVVF
jgi:hypothetical protein